MTQPLVECIPNFSEARRPHVVEAILAAIQAVEGVHILDQHSDMDHNRTVVTYVGPPAAVEEAAFKAIAKAAELIDLDQHSGEHPRLGATDVVPFVPISGVSMLECVEMARRLGRRVGDELKIPVYLYEEAATRPDRVNLEDIRRGQYEALKAEIGMRPERKPDFGPLKVGPAGGTVIGARHPLIAFNAYLTTTDVEIARKIAKAVRNSSGGLRYVKGLGLLVEGRAQVSMNLTNYRQTPIARVVEFVRREAERYGVGIHHCELVGLIPQEALIDAAVWYTQLDQFEPLQVLENRLQTPESKSGGAAGVDFVDALAAGTPAPGGGSASAYAGAMAAALAAMVARLTVGKKKYAGVEAQMWALIEAAEKLRQAQTAGVAEDAAAFEAVLAANRLPKDTPEQEQVRKAAQQTAALQAARVPLSAARRCAETLELLAQAAELGNLNAISDAGTGAELAQAGLRGSGYNVRINLSGLSEHPEAAALLAELKTIETQAAGEYHRVRAALSQRGGMALD